jgi:hypothetical protein
MKNRDEFFVAKLTVIHSRAGFLDEARKVSGGFRILTNVDFENGRHEAIRLNVGFPKSHIRRSSADELLTIQTLEPPFLFTSPSLLISSSELHWWQRKFNFVSDALGKEPLAAFSINDVRHEVWLPMLQELSSKLVGLNDDMIDY